MLFRPVPHVTRSPAAFVARRRLRLAACLLALLTFLQVAGAQEAEEVPRDAGALLDAMVDNMRGSGQRATMELVVERPGETRTYTLDIVSDGTERSLTRVVAPPRDAGQAFLVDGTDLFIYTPRLGRVLRLPPSGRSDGFLGSDLSYDDLAGDEVRDRYEASVAEWREDEGEVELSLRPKPRAPTPYGELRFTASLPDLAPLELEYFDQRDAMVKRLTFSEFEETPAGHRVPRRFEVTDLTEEGSRTVARWTEVEDDVSPPERCFTQQALERGCDW